MASNKLTDGVGKKIVEALKMQSNEDFDLNNNNSPMMNNPEKIESNQSFEGFDKHSGSSRIFCSIYTSAFSGI